MASKGNHLVISFMTLSELSLWPVRNNWGAERRALLKNFIALFTPLFPDEETCLTWADISAESLASGHPMGTADAWIAACARQWGMALVTGNYRDFQLARLEFSEMCPLDNHRREADFTGPICFKR